MVIASYGRLKFRASFQTVGLQFHAFLKSLYVNAAMSVYQVLNKDAVQDSCFVCCMLCVLNDTTSRSWVNEDGVTSFCYY